MLYAHIYRQVHTHENTFVEVWRCHTYYAQFLPNLNQKLSKDFPIA